jgi:hypothetical protein
MYAYMNDVITSAAIDSFRDSLIIGNRTSEAAYLTAVLTNFTSFVGGSPVADRFEAVISTHFNGYVPQREPKIGSSNNNNILASADVAGSEVVYVSPQVSRFSSWFCLR